MAFQGSMGGGEVGHKLAEWGVVRLDVGDLTVFEFKAEGRNESAAGQQVTLHRLGTAAYAQEADEEEGGGQAAFMSAGDLGSSQNQEGRTSRSSWRSLGKQTHS